MPGNNLEHDVVPVNPGGDAKALDRFLQPEMPVTPAVLSTIASLGSAKIANILHLPDAGYVLLVMSGILGLVTIVNAAGITSKSLYWLINSIIILITASGTTLLMKDIASTA